ncbi:hypothetical protein [Kitasatospora sp. NPDC057500]|uniref:hypothetical protein n=1 Tax=Kitasatospora sp. NPDC057500 TaxID=3346151 RepID=UPI0036750CFE
MLLEVDFSGHAASAKACSEVVEHAVLQAVVEAAEELPGPPSTDDPSVESARGQHLYEQTLRQDALT